MSAPTRPPRFPVRPSRSVLDVLVEVVARIGTAVTLAALLVVTGTVLATVEAQPTPTGVTTVGR